MVAVDRSRQKSEAASQRLSTGKYPRLKRRMQEHLAEQSVNSRGRKCLSLDCEMVGVGERKISALARCSVVDVHGHVVLDEYVKPVEKITDYRTRWSGIRPCHMLRAKSFRKIQRQVARLLKDTVLVGHAVHHDMAVLNLHHAKEDIRDTANCKALRHISHQQQPSLRSLASIHLDRSIQQSEHDSVEDARTAMDLYRMFEDQWETDLACSNVNMLADEYWPSEVVCGANQCAIAPPML